LDSISCGKEVFPKRKILCSIIQIIKKKLGKRPIFCQNSWTTELQFSNSLAWRGVKSETNLVRDEAESSSLFISSWQIFCSTLMMQCFLNMSVSIAFIALINSNTLKHIFFSLQFFLKSIDERKLFQPVNYIKSQEWQTTTIQSIPDENNQVSLSIFCCSRSCFTHKYVTIGKKILLKLLCHADFKAGEFIIPQKSR